MAKKMKKGYIILGVLLILLFLTAGYETGHSWMPYQYWGGMMDGMGMMHHHGMGMHHMGMGGLGFGGFGLLFWVLVLAFAYILISRNGLIEKKEDAIDILNRRLARGEITKEEYISMKKEIVKKR